MSPVRGIFSSDTQRQLILGAIVILFDNCPNLQVIYVCMFSFQKKTLLIMSYCVFQVEMEFLSIQFFGLGQCDSSGSESIKDWARH